MALLESGPNTRLELPSFSLADASGHVWHSTAVTGVSGTLVVFACNHCPYVQHIAPGFARVADALSRWGIGVVAINSNAPDRVPEDSAAHMIPFAEAARWDFPYLVDEDQEVARRFAAVCTPDFFLFDARSVLFYRGQLDASRPGNGVDVTGTDLLAAASEMARGDLAPSRQVPSIGCSIKWRRQGVVLGDTAH